MTPIGRGLEAEAEVPDHRGTKMAPAQAASHEYRADPLSSRDVHQVDDP